MQTRLSPSHLPMSVAWNAWQILLICLVACCVLGCAQPGAKVNHTPDGEKAETAAFYWQYAALAADVYQTGGQVDAQLGLVMMSRWLRDELATTDNMRARARYEKLLTSADRRSEPERGNFRCATFAPRRTNEVTNDRGSADFECIGSEAASEIEDDEPEISDEQSKDLAPETAADCQYNGDKEPSVPVHEAVREYKWEQVPELRRQLHPRGWSIFVPGLAIDVWRRKLPNEQSISVEYALVYRGTVGTGAWLSNFRAVTAVTPLVWDQYRQAKTATSDLIKQIQNLHRLSDDLFERHPGTKVRITAVGHSLGGGLAKYVFLRIPEITRVVGFDPSPVDGSSTFSPEPIRGTEHRSGRRDRESVLSHPNRSLYRDSRDPTAAMFMLYEEGEALTRIGGCYSGPLWGSEGGPVVKCESLDLSGGSIFHQHNMAQLACKLYLAKNGQSTK